MAQQSTQRRKSFVIFGIIFLLAALAGIATFTFLAKLNNTVRVFYVKAPAGIQAYQRITADDLGIASVQADALKLAGGDKYQYVWAFDSEAKDAKGQADGGLSKLVGQYATVPLAYGELLLKFKLADAEGGSYKAGLYERPGTKLLTFEVSLVNALAGQLAPGDYMDVLYTDKQTGETKKVLANVQVIDVKYGSNPFSRNAVKTEEAKDSGVEADPSQEEAVSTRNPLANTVNPALGDRAVFIISVPGNMVNSIAPQLVDSGGLFLVATTPPTANAGSTDATGTPAPADEDTATP